MKKLFLIGSTLFLSLFFSGCISSNFNYTPPQNSNNMVKNEKMVNGEFKKNWDTIVEKLSENSFVINNMNKDSGFINISFSTNQPSTYVDCGKWNGHFKNLRVDQNYHFNGADSRSYYSAMGAGAGQVQITTNLSGRINLLLKDLEDNQQKYKVNIKYILDLKTKAQAFHEQFPYHQNSNINFNTNGKGNIMPSGQTQCISNGYLENQILDYIN